MKHMNIMIPMHFSPGQWTLGQQCKAATKDITFNNIL